MDVKLVVDKGPAKTKSITLRSEETIVGRQKGNDLRIPSPDVSRRHCLLRFQDDYLTVEDLDSANGTFLNGERVVAKEVVRPGDRLEIGPLVFVVEYQLTQAAIDKLLRDGMGPANDDFVEVLPEDEVETVRGKNTPVEPAAFEEDPADDLVTLDDSIPLVMPDDGELRDILSRLADD